MAEAQAKVRIVGVDTKLFEDLRGEQLLQATRSGALNGTKAQLHEVLGRIREKYGPEENKKNRKICRDKRIKVYNYLLLVALEAEGDDWKLWTTDPSAKGLWATKPASKLVADSIYTYLLDQIHEDEQIMFKHYHVENKSRESLERAAYFLVESIKVYRKHLVTPIVEALKDWPKEDGKEETKAACRRLLEDAKKVFKDIVSSHGRSWGKRSWRNRARLYWVLALAKHAQLSKGRLGKFKSYGYKGPIGILVREMIEEDTEMLLESAEDSIFGYERAKFDKEKKELQLGNFKICRLLSWASAASDHDLVKCILQHKDDYMKSDECDWKWEESWEEAWADALWNAAYKGHYEIVRELLNCEFPYHELYFKYYSENKMQPPLHVAVRRKHISVVEAFCTESKKFSCHDENVDKQTPLEVAGDLKDEAIKKKIQGILLQRPEVKQAVEDLCSHRELAVGSANAILVGAALIAGVTYAGWLQPPLGYESYYQFPKPLPAPSDQYESYLSVQGHTCITVFAIFNSLSFFCAIAAVVAGMETTCFIEAPEETYMRESVKKLRNKLRRTTCLFIASVICVLIAFASAGIAILPPIKRHQNSMYSTIGVGGFLCMVFVGRMLWLCVFKRLNSNTKKFLSTLFSGGCRSSQRET